MDIRIRRYSHPDAVKLTAELQQEYLLRYGMEDVTPVDPAQFASPLGAFLVGYEGQTPVVLGGWRARDHSELGYSDGDAEIKRMYVIPEARGNGHARVLLAVLEESAREAGRIRMVLETGLRQPEAIALYRSCGYTDTTKFGVHRYHELNVCLAKPLRRLTIAAGQPPGG